jgi:chromosome segregation ATPase
MTTENLTYSELGERLGSSAEAARSLARRLRLVRKPGNDGKVRVIVDFAEIQYKPAPTRSTNGPQADIDALNVRIEELQAELAKLEMEKNCLEASVAEHRADFERERDRCDKLIAETLVLNKVAMSARENAARLEGEVSARRGRRRWWGRLVTPRHARGQRPAERSVTTSGPAPHQVIGVPAGI